MRSILVAFVVLLAAGRANAAGWGDPNTLTKKEIAEGWLLLFDGATTFGWKINGEAKVQDGKLILGGNRGAIATTTTAFLYAEVQIHGQWHGRRMPIVEIGGSKAVFPRRIVADKPFSYSFRLRAGSVRLNKPAPITVYVPAGSSFTISTLMLLPLNSKSLFNGKNLDGWKVHPNKKSKFTVTKEGWLNVKDGPGDLQTTGKYKDFLLQLECISNGKHLNSGIFFRCIPDQYQQGYEAQIRNQFTDKPTQTYTIDKYDPKTHQLIGKEKIASLAVDFGTGAIYRRMPARLGVAKDGEWFTMTVVAHGNHFSTWVNGVQVVDWTDHRPPNDNARQGCCANAGPISIQGHDPTTDLSFRNLRIVEYPSK